MDALEPFPSCTFRDRPHGRLLTRPLALPFVARGVEPLDRGMRPSPAHRHVLALEWEDVAGESAHELEHSREHDSRRAARRPERWWSLLCCPRKNSSRMGQSSPISNPAASCTKRVRIRPGCMEDRVGMTKNRRGLPASQRPLGAAGVAARISTQSCRQLEAPLAASVLRRGGSGIAHQARALPRRVPVTLSLAAVQPRLRRRGVSTRPRTHHHKRPTASAFGLTPTFERQ
jgi:hypothetical protein